MEFEVEASKTALYGGGGDKHYYACAISHPTSCLKKPTFFSNFSGSCVLSHVDCK